MYPWVAVLIVVAVIAVIAFVIVKIVLAHLRQPTTGHEELLNKSAVVRDTLNPEGSVFFEGEGELWAAISREGRIESGEEVTITKVEDLVLHVKRRTKEVGKT